MLKDEMDQYLALYLSRIVTGWCGRALVSYMTCFRVIIFSTSSLVVLGSAHGNTVNSLGKGNN